MNWARRGSFPVCIRRGRSTPEIKCEKFLNREGRRDQDGETFPSCTHIVCYARRRSVVFAIPTGRSTCRWSVCVTADGRVVDLAKGTFKVQLASRVVAVSFFPLNGNLLVFCRLSFVTVIAFPSGTLPYPEFRREFPRRARQVRLLAFARARSMAAYTCMCVYVRMCARARAYIYINARNNSSVSDVLIDSFVYLHHLSICLSHWDGNNNNNNCFSFTHQTLMILIIKS